MSQDGQFFDAFDTFFWMTYSSHEIALTCFDGFEESFLGYKQLIQLYDQPKILIQNLIYNFGDIWDNMRDFVEYYVEEQRGVYNIPYLTGKLLGNSFYLLFQPVNNATSNPGYNPTDNSLDRWIVDSGHSGN